MSRTKQGASSCQKTILYICDKINIDGSYKQLKPNAISKRHQKFYQILLLKTCSEVLLGKKYVVLPY